jgi:hypothetical protein
VRWKYRFVPVAGTPGCHWRGQARPQVLWEPLRYVCSYLSDGTRKIVSLEQVALCPRGLRKAGAQEGGKMRLRK